MLDLGRPFRRADALAAGLTDRQLRSARFERLHAGIYLAADQAPTPLLRAEAALLAFREGAFASHATAARVWRLPVPTLPDEHVTVLTDAGRRRRAGVRCHIERVEQWESDLERREAIDESGWRILVVVSSGIYGNPGRTLERIHRVLLERRLPGTPTRLRSDWQRHFPGRP